MEAYVLVAVRETQAGIDVFVMYRTTYFVGYATRLRAIRITFFTRSSIVMDITGTRYSETRHRS